MLIWLWGYSLGQLVVVWGHRALGVAVGAIEVEGQGVVGGGCLCEAGGFWARGWLVLFVGGVGDGVGGWRWGVGA